MAKGIERQEAKKMHSSGKENTNYKTAGNKIMPNSVASLWSRGSMLSATVGTKQHGLLLLLFNAISLYIGFASKVNVHSQNAYSDNSVLDLSADSTCEFDEIQLASDGTIAQWGLAHGSRITPNVTVNGSVMPNDYNFYHLCVGRQEHEHLILVELLCDTGDMANDGDANLYLSGEVKYPRIGHSTWIAQRHGNEKIKIYTYLDGFPRNDEHGGRRWLSLHISVFGAGQVSTSYALAITVSDLPTTPDLSSRQAFYTKQRILDRKESLRHRSPE
ncbi:uncharacterized protein PHALS_09418 [Plasmopara halstedii]|uniref:Uncharacterized protein n=1 Tax=Plasmopara halstedii TaxID=4781 RepID=A0A0N7L3A0_PLAHL|nr:uncharacterized protein PHALS_09418 [Plasmopara halstedii]CEG35291.1 hypothetical protein PHALS_09418 [Plasmopara halstedii]|eukprot:XP_024571660.1 hypothetical protein PHALS_09418 [Plasmopara halstedii]